MAFDLLFGNEEIKTLLVNTINFNKILHSYLFVGIDGIGKKLFAQEFAKMILCNSQNKEECNDCKSCIEYMAGNHPDFMEIDSEDGKNIKIEQIRYLQEKIAEKPVTSNKKVYLINDCELMTKEAANCLLKTLEEPPVYAVIILITSNESKLLPTIKSRCTKINFLPISNEKMQDYIKNEKIEDLPQFVIKQSGGSIGNFLKIQKNIEEYKQIEELVDCLNKESIASIWNKAEILYKEKDTIIDYLDYINIICLEKYRAKSNLGFLNCITIIEQAKKRIIENANFDMTIDNLLLKMWEEIN